MCILKKLGYLWTKWSFVFYFSFYDKNKTCNPVIQMDDRCTNLGCGIRNLTESLSQTHTIFPFSFLNYVNGVIYNKTFQSNYTIFVWAHFQLNVFNKISTKYGFFSLIFLHVKNYLNLKTKLFIQLNVFGGSECKLNVLNQLNRFICHHSHDLFSNLALDELDTQTLLSPEKSLYLQ
jgi:hypothetical protein